jgi:dTDP-4-amino-4,6-dideoxygalactose transaminase
MIIPFHKPIFPTDINALLDESITSGWVTTGPKVIKFESKLCAHFNAKHVIAVNSCTAALHLALAAKGIGFGDKYIVPTYTFVASVEVGEYLGAKPILVDSESGSFNMDLNQVEEILQKDQQRVIRAIIPVHFAGQALDMKRVNQLAEKYDLFVLEDAAHALETFSNEGKVGDTNFAAAFSFYANKNITTGGEGGALATNDDDLAERVRKLSLHGMSRDGWKRFETGGKWSYDVSDLGYKYNMTDISATFGLEQLQHIYDWHSRRTKIVNKYSQAFSDIDGFVLPKHTSSNIHAWHLYVVRIIPAMWKITRNDIIAKINEKGIGTSVHYIPIHMHSYYVKKYGYISSDYPIANNLSETVITLPLYPKMTKEQINYVVSVLGHLWSEYKI